MLNKIFKFTVSDVIWGLLAGFATTSYVHTTGCLPNDNVITAQTYATNLEECNRTSKTLCESIKCENRWRQSYGRATRAVPVICFLDSGIVDSGNDHE